MIRVYIDAQAPVMHAGLEALLSESDGFAVVSVAEEADVILREGGGFAGASPVPLVLLSDDPPVIRNGIRAAIPRAALPQQIFAALHAAAAGLVAVPFESAQAIAETRPVEEAGFIDAPTPREMEVLEMLAEGLSNKQIAARLEISEHTAKFHVNSLLGKLHAGNRAEAVTRGIRAGILKV